MILQLLRKVATSRGDSAFRPGSHRVAVNVVLMHLCKKTLPLAAEPPGSQPHDCPRNEIGMIDETLAVSIDRIVLERSVNSLPPDFACCSCFTMCRATNTRKSRMMRCSVENFRIGPTNRAFASWDEDAAAKLREELETLWSTHNRGGDELTFVVAEYLEVIAIRA